MGSTWAPISPTASLQRSTDPAVRPPSVGRPMATDPVTTARRGTTSARLRVLVAEDNATLSRLSMRLVARLGHDVETVSTGAEAVGEVAEGGAAEGGAFSDGDPGGIWEECDDHNATSGDGCSESCTLEPGWACWYVGEACHRVVCGDGYADWPEECDDGNSDPDDGCDACRWDGAHWGTGGSFAAGGAGSSPSE